MLLIIGFFSDCYVGCVDYLWNVKMKMGIVWFLS